MFGKYGGTEFDLLNPLLFFSDTASGEVLTKKTEPALVGYGWIIMNPNGLPTHSGDIAEAIEMDSTSGKLTMKNLQSDGQKALVRLTALVDVKKEQEGEVTTTVRKRYMTDPIPVLSDGDTWPDESEMDCESHLLSTSYSIGGFISV